MAVSTSGVATIDIPVPVDMAAEIDSIAAARHVSRDRALTDLLRDAITAYEERRVAFLDLAGRFQQSRDPAETEQLRSELSQMTFGS